MMCVAMRPSITILSILSIQQYICKLIEIFLITTFAQAFWRTKRSDVFLSCISVDMHVSSVLYMQRYSIINGL